MSVAARTAERVEAPRAAHARAGTRATPLLAALVGASFLVRLVAGWLRAGPTFFPDEYIYAELARSLAETGQPLIRGAGASFPALLQPLLTAPAWLAGDVETAFRAVQAFGAVAMSLAAVPIFLLARRLGLGTGMALALAAFGLAVPDLVYAGWVVAEPVAYPLALGAIAVGTMALARPRGRTQAAFLVLVALAVLARVQFAVLPLCFLAAVAIVGLRERRLRAVLREQRIVLAVFALPLIALLALGPGRALGFYRGALDIDVASGSMAKWFGVDALLLVYSSGIVLAPGALLGLWLALRRPRSRQELAFGALAAPVIVALLLEAAAYGIGGDRAQERYFFYAIPLVALAFALYASRGWPHRLAFGAIAAALVALTVRVPLAGLAAADRKAGSPTLIAHARLEEIVDDVALASLVVAILVSVLLCAVVLATRRPAVATPVALGLAFGVCAAASAGVLSHSLANAERTQADVFGTDPSFVDRSGLEGTALVQTRSSPHGVASAYLFWNRSVEAVYLLPDAQPPDGFAVTRLTVAADGTLLAAGDPVTRPLLADGLSDTVRFRASETVAESNVYRLVRATQPHRLALYAPGLYGDGWLGLRGSVQLWPESAGEGLAGTLTLRLGAPEGVDRAVVAFRQPGEPAEAVTVGQGSSREVSFTVCAPGPWRLDFAAPSTGSVDGRYVSVRASEPVYRPDPDAC